MYKNLFRAGGRLKISIVGVVLEGFLGGCNFLVLFQVLNLIFEGRADLNGILKITAILAILTILRMLLYTTSYTASQIGGADVSRGLRIGIGDKLKKIPLGLFTKNRTGFYINAATGEVGDYEQILTHKLADIIKHSCLVFMLSLYTGYLYFPVGAIMLITLLLLIPALLISVRQVNLYGKRKNLAREENVSAITEYLMGSQTLRSYGLVGRKHRTLIDTMKNYSNISYEYERAILPIGFVYVYLAYIGFAASIILAVAAYVDKVISPSVMILLIMMPLYAAKVNMTLYISLVSYRNLLISKNKICKIFEEREEKTGHRKFVPQSADIIFHNVCFAYEDKEPVLKGIDFTIKRNSLTAIVGDSGSGKSTLFNLLSKYYEPDSGNITIGGVDIAEFSAEEVLSRISLVDQEVFLFNDTVLENVRYAREDATDEEIMEACRLANCHEFIQNMEQGYLTNIGENGNKLSGGERQRLSVARAILRNSPIILLDEATASLDIENELLVKKAVENLLRADKTVIMIAHTLSIVKEADNILVLDDGRIIESGTHEVLARAGGKYESMWTASLALK